MKSNVCAFWHAVKDSAQVLEERVRHELRRWEDLLSPVEEPGLPSHTTNDQGQNVRKTLPLNPPEGIFPGSRSPNV